MGLSPFAVHHNNVCYKKVSPARNTNLALRFHCQHAQETRTRKAQTLGFIRHTAFKKRHVALQFAYLGWNYSGLAMQKGYPLTIMQKIMESLQKCRLVEETDTPQFAVCGRTDKGVSAVNQVCPPPDSGPSCSERQIPSNELDYVFLLNKVLPPDIRVIAWSPVEPDFNARFSCTQRAYCYFLPLSGLNLEAMQVAGHRLEGTHDFRNFCSSPVDEGIVTFVRRIDRVHIQSSGPECSAQPPQMATPLCFMDCILRQHYRSVCTIKLFAYPMQTQ
ncbi:unnamed protein product [Echinostoma caproni]|uniref:tRNA pseudouridine(38-40) synthase n=1 Tax=Echinostoma caproni TaxID=27848 RepID=A0A183A8F8_9TREM|nr:unnamed protein product [Echinostoma caproni]